MHIVTHLVFGTQYPEKRSDLHLISLIVPNSHVHFQFVNITLCRSICFTISNIYECVCVCGGCVIVTCVCVCWRRRVICAEYRAYRYDVVAKPSFLSSASCLAYVWHKRHDMCVTPPHTHTYRQIVLNKEQTAKPYASVLHIEMWQPTYSISLKGFMMTPPAPSNQKPSPR